MGANGSIPYIYASIIAPVPDLIAEQGGRAERPFRESGVPIELASEPERVLPVRDYLCLLEAAARETGDELFGVSLAERIEIDDLGPVGRLISGAPTLRRAVETTNALVRHYSPACRSWLVIHGDTVCWHYQLTGDRDRRKGRRLDGEQTLILLRTVVRMAAGPSWRPCEFLLEQETPLDARVLQSRLGAPARCDDTTYGLVFRCDLLDLPMTYSEPLAETERQTLLARLMSSDPEDSFVGSVRALIRSQLCGGYPDVTAVARSAGLSVRTFQRRLAETGVAYTDLVAQVRRELARALLADRSRSQLDISMTLGYSDAANFSRAFKHWHGLTPGQFRQSLERSPAAD